MEEKDILSKYNITDEDLMRVVTALKIQAETAERSMGKVHLREGTYEDYFETEYKFLKLGAERGNLHCCMFLGELLQGGKVKSVREAGNGPELAVEWWTKAAEAGMMRSYTNIGLIHLHKPIPGGGKDYGNVPYDEKLAFSCFLKATEGDDIKAPRHVGLCYRDGVGTEKDEQKAFQYFKMAADRGDSTGKLYVADCLLNGDGTEQNVDEAVKIYEQLVETRAHDMTKAANALAHIYKDGVYVEKDLTKAEEYFRFVISSADKLTADLVEPAKHELELMGKTAE